MKRLLLLAALALAACGGADDDDTAADTTTTSSTTAEPEPTTTTVEELDPVELDPVQSVLDRIEALTDCAELQEEFDTASANSDRVEPGSPAADVALKYMEAADDRLQELGCYG